MTFWSHWFGLYWVIGSLLPNSGIMLEINILKLLFSMLLQKMSHGFLASAPSFVYVWDELDDIFHSLLLFVVEGSRWQRWHQRDVTVATGNMVGWSVSVTARLPTEELRIWEERVKDQSETNIYSVSNHTYVSQPETAEGSCYWSLIPPNSV